MGVLSVLLHVPLIALVIHGVIECLILRAGAGAAQIPQRSVSTASFHADVPCQVSSAAPVPSLGDQFCLTGKQ